MADDERGDMRGAIVVGVDGSPSAKAALRWAAAEARLTGSPLRAVTVWQYPSLYALGPLRAPDDVAASAGELLSRAVAQALGPAQAGATQLRVVLGDPAEVLLAEARDARLLVLGSHGCSGFTDALLGSVTQHCIYHATGPVVVVREPPTEDDPPEHDAGG